MPAASGYEVSIYEAFSPDFWFLYILIIFSSIGLSFHSILKNTNWWKGYLAIILIMNLLVLFLPIIRGYEFYGRGGSDVYYHLAGAKHILNTGLIMESDIYPIIHIITAILNIIGLSDSLHLTTIISSTFYIVYLFSLYALGRAMMKSERGGALLAIFGSPFLFSFGHFAFYPFLFSLFLLPLVLYCICGANCIDKKNRYYLCLVPLILFIVFCHPMTTIILSITLITLYIHSRVILKYYPTRGLNIMTLLSIVGIAFLYWYISFASVKDMAKRSLLAIIGIADADTILDHNVNLIQQSGASLLSIIEMYIKVYGSITIYLIVGTFISFIFISRFFAKRELAGEMAYGLLFFTSITYGLALITGYFIIFEPIRAASFAIVMATIVCGAGTYFLIKEARTKCKRAIIGLIMTGIVCSVSFLTLFGVYYSPWTSSIGAHITEMDNSGTNWFLDYSDESIPLYSNVGPLSKYIIYYYEQNQIEVRKPTIIIDEIPSHFGYYDNNHFSHSLNNIETNYSYIVTNEMMRRSGFVGLDETKDLRKYFLQEDFYRLELDPTVNKIYINGEKEFWIVG